MADMVKAVLNGDFEIIVPKHRADRPEWYTEKGWEKQRLRHMALHLGSEDVVYYVGAEEGEMCAIVAQLGCKVFMFEPNERVMPNMRAIWEANNLDMGDMFYPGFAGNEVKGSQNLWRIDEIKGEVIHDHGFKELRDPGDIPITTIDYQVEKMEHQVPTMITMDVEGSEFEVLRGAEQTIRQHHPKIYLSLHPEFLHEQYGEWGAELRKWLIDMGYTEELIDYPLHEVHLYYEAKA